MIIDENKLVALLVEKTGQPREELKEQLSEFKARIKTNMELDKPLEVDNLGVFFSRDGVLQFEPAEQMKTEVNQKYVGMQPIELIKAVKQKGAGVPVEERMHKSYETKSNEPEKKDVPLKQKNEEQTEESTPDQPEKQKEEEPALILEQDALTQRKQQKKPPPTKQKYAQSREKNSSRNKAIIAVVAVMVILGAGWLLYVNGVFDSSNGKNEAVTSGANKNTTSVGRAMATPKSDSTRQKSAPGNEAEQKSGNKVSTTKSSTQNSASEIYGLKGTFNKQAPNAYTIVIHSFRKKFTVQHIADSLQKRGYRTVLFRGSKRTGFRWRVGLGQFKTIEQAQEAAKNLNQPYKKHHFIRRINH